MNNFLKFGLFIICCAIIFSIFIKCRLNKRSTHLAFREGVREYCQTGKYFNPIIKHTIGNNYFKDQKKYKLDFSNSLKHIATTGTAQEFSKPSKNIFKLTEKDYMSSPACLKIKALEFPCRIFYSTQENSGFLNRAWALNSPAWLAVKPNTQVMFSSYYKGKGPTVRVSFLDQAGDFNTLKTKIFPPSDVWDKFEFAAKIPENGRAVMVEIQMTSLNAGDIMFLDDFSIEGF